MISPYKSSESSANLGRSRTASITEVVRSGIELGRILHGGVWNGPFPADEYLWSPSRATSGFIWSLAALIAQAARMATGWKIPSLNRGVGCTHRSVGSVEQRQRT